MPHSLSPTRRAFGFRFVTLARAWRRAIDLEIAAAGLTDATWTPLIHLSESGDDISQTELARRVGLDGSTLVRLIDILEGAGLIERQVDPDDRRARRILLTQTGRAEVDRIRARLLEIETRLLADIDDAALQTISTAFASVSTRVEDVLADHAKGTDK